MRVIIIRVWKHLYSWKCIIFIFSCMRCKGCITPGALYCVLKF